ncbi:MULTISPECIES: hydroxypyruvate reductase [Thermotoga]|jgi:D-3-phosphoglycerate dehydrogenase|uniref:D-isomer specific 2-hydroxyacid dehydrogenase, NAD-binding n=1 Tax=Thermotoga neapolitana (strain ATCC 49049 / DSM 4359 / NBRC 107923 / NS-E) TaxID=309803 RepID=B9K8T3_THENN|nr:MULTISPECIES: hydroxypyruvate reductase [Thermotoga]MDK2785914.1 hydroxypyruvate reductase [Thermotoga sp.]HBF11219.1 3-phosphoglycerate dehydrogenase [Thermotoga neapolitana]ACM23366.1 D-isomer specific 2-hydroxyacid dehydrogenase, NAD-binding [Thermotoga neapolitana DSM 4359]AJG41276.1 3-phosphoglycerate dehydrogenase [Thermotoga sp. RQ7]KFZ21500.1 D-isomer specific 2-hydroxyacid dehydrogenase, NAD-binding protein [Thermotoga neapolitana LA10]
MAKYRVHVNDPLDEEATKLLMEKEELTVTSRHLEKEELLKTISEVDVLVVRSATKVTSDIIEAGKNLKIIARAGIGLDNIDVQKAKEKGIKILNTPGASAPSVAELAIGLMLACARHIAKATISLKEGKWEKKILKGKELLGKTLGLIGFGNIGQEVARRALGFGMRVIAYDPARPKTDLPVEYVDLDTLLKESDFISLHVPLIESTKHMINKDTISKMKDGVIIVNTSRGGTIDEEALYEALVSGKVYAAGLDVFEVEPPSDELRRKLLSLDNVVATPHIGASTAEAQKRVGKELVEKIFRELGI